MLKKVAAATTVMFALSAGTASAGPMIVAHQGSNVSQQETVGAYNRGARYADVLDGDIRFTRDGVAVIHHNSRLDGTCAGKKINRTKWRTVQQCVKSGGGRVIRLTSMLSIASQNNLKVSLEFKTHPKKSQIRTVVRELKRYDLKNKTYLFSFKTKTLRKIRNMHLGLQTGLLSQRPVSVAKIKKYGGVFSIYWRNMTPQLARYYGGITLFAHTTHSEWADGKAVAAGADAIVTGDSYRTRNYLRKS